MVSLIFLIISVLVALGFARYNKSNKLFWILTISLLTGFTGAKMVASITGDHKSETSIVKQSVPMQPSTCSLQALQPSEGADTLDETKAAGKDSLHSDTIACITLGDQHHIEVMTPPPQSKQLKTNFIFDTS